jgi:hypothetical protein
MVQISAESPDPFVTTAREYLEVKVVARAKSEGFKTVSKPRAVNIGGRDSFVRADRSGTISGKQVYETWVVALDKGVALQFEFVGGSQAELDEIVKSLDSVRFDPETPPAQKP